ncbi:gastrula zinc finger protein xFG20-1-like [Sabethes cyaneus]|uniref:gastrula zinc finger protein xFG20-1-like n=1 Tax=Sabethes cyaneus TaxID=53552 RepID=UPI00237E5BC1|nr:gastrula zinc finger protein xFG20-1-like [Sabethes cyaneus]
MSAMLLNSLIECGFKVCRFCLQSNEEELSDIYKEDLEKTVSMNITVRNVLNLLEISVSPSDANPKFICRVCRKLLFSIQRFRDTVHKSAQTIAQAKLLKQFPSVRFAEVFEPEYDEPAAKVKIKEDVSSYKCEPETSTQTIKIEEVTVKDEQTTFLCDESDKPAEEGFENPDGAVSESEYPETEWVVYDEVTDDMQEDKLEQSITQSEPDTVETKNVVPITLEIHKNESEQDTPSKKRSNAKQYARLCTICGASSTAMVVHMRTHSKDKPFVCETCNKGFYTRNKLRCHINSVHLNIREFHCELCEKSFVLRKTLKAHMLSHMAEKSHVCSYCPKSFLYRWARTKHERTHTGEKPFRCTLDGCGKSFASSSNLRQHQKTGAHQGHRQNKT